MSLVTVWDGKSIRFEEAAKAATDAAAGKLQIWKGALNAQPGWDPGFYMKHSKEFSSGGSGDGGYVPPAADPGAPVIALTSQGSIALLTGSDATIFIDGSVIDFVDGDTVTIDGIPATSNTFMSGALILGNFSAAINTKVGQRWVQVLTKSGLHSNALQITFAAPTPPAPPAGDDPAPPADPEPPCPPKKSK